jgi:hypothetical protein
MLELLASHFSYYLCAAQSYDATQKYSFFTLPLGLTGFDSNVVG